MISAIFNFNFKFNKFIGKYIFSYSSHMAGKWHLGYYKRLYTPLYRGFRSHVGYWTGHHDYFNHTAVERCKSGLDIRNGRVIEHEGVVDS